MTIRRLVLIALLGASLNAFKFSLMYIPNVEVVTLLIVVYTYVFGLGISLPSVLIFCVLEGCIFGFNPSWLIAYFIHWPAIAGTAFVLKLLKIKNPVPIAIAVALVTACFGLQSTLTYYVVGGAVGKLSNFWGSYWAAYASGAAFYIAHTVFNFIFVLLGFPALTRLLQRLSDNYLPQKKDVL